MVTATIIPLSIQRMVCTACGAEANASCNCGVSYMPAVAKAARVAEQQRQASKAYRDRKRQENQPARHMTPASDDDWKKKAEWDARAAERWRNALLTYAHDVGSMREGFTENFGSAWKQFPVTLDMVEAADHAVREWQELAAFLRRRLT